jgi:Zn-dependent peptidase ImmA (M78 family)/transcriptional regulator with XRE-family HTH domain
MTLDKTNAVELGERLRFAREEAGCTQADAAGQIGVARTTLVSIEKGQRKARLSELQNLAQLYGTSVNTLLRREAVQVDLIPQFRKMSATEDLAVRAAAEVLVQMVKAEVELEDILGIERPRNFPPERPILPGNVRNQAEGDANELRSWLGLGFSPVRDFISLLEMQIGIRVYVLPLDAKVAGLFAYESEVGACILVNANHPAERRAQTMAHELGHFIGTRAAPDIFHIDEAESSREEKYANMFGRAFLTPARAVSQKFREVTAGAKKLTRRHIIILAHYFGVSREAMVRRLEELQLTKLGTWDWFSDNGGITQDQVKQVLGGLYTAQDQGEVAASPTTLRLNTLAEQAWRRGLLSEGQLSRLLGIDRISVREIIDKLDLEGDEADELPDLPG